MQNFEFNPGTAKEEKFPKKENDESQKLRYT
jgi:hypothetical protein